MASDPEIVAIELIGNVDRFKRDTKASADDFGKQVDRIEKDAERGEGAVKKMGIATGDALSANDNKASGQIENVTKSAKLATAETERLKRVAEAAAKAFERIPEVKAARSIDPAGFGQARDQFVNGAIDQEKINIAEGLPESTEAFDAIGASSGKSAAGLARFAGAAGVALVALELLRAGVVASLDAFQESERNLAKLNAQLISSGNLSLATGDQIAQFADQVSDATLQVETSTQSAAATLATVPGLTAEAFEEALSVSARFADAMQTDVADVVSDIVGPAFTALADNDIEALYDSLEGLNPTLARTVIELADAGKTADAQAALLAGLTEAAGDGPGGLTTAADQLSERWKDTKEELGEDISAVTVPIMNAILDAVDAARQAAANLGIGWRDLAITLASPITGIVNIVRRQFGDEPAASSAGSSAGAFAAAREREAANVQRRRSEQAQRDREILQNRFNRSPARASRGGGGGGGGESAADKLQRERDEELRRVQAFNRQLQQAQDQVLRGETALAEGVDELRALQLQAIEISRARLAAEIAADVQAGKLRQDEADQLLALNEERAELQSIAAERTADERALKERLASQRAQFNADEQGIGIDASFESEQRFVQADILQGQLDLARTQKERREVEARLLDLQFEEEKARNDYLIGFAERLETQEGTTESELAVARAAAAEAELRNASLELRRAQAGEASSRATAGPLEAFFQGIPQGADEINEALESVASGGLTSVTDGLVGIAVNFQSLEDTALSVLQSITAALVKLAIQQLIVKSLGGALGFSDGGPIGAAGLAFGGPVRRMNTGGLISGPGGPTEDLVPALGPNGPIRLSDGEFVLRAAAVQSLGIDTVAALNRNGRIPGLNMGGSIGTRAAGRGGAGMAMLDPQSLARLGDIVAAAAAAQPDVNLFPTTDPAQALKASLATRGGGQVFFDFMQANAGRVRTSDWCIMAYDVLNAGSASIFAFLPDLNRGFTIQRSFATDIFSSRNGKEQRRATRDRPRYAISYSSPLRDDELHSARQYLRSRQNAPTAIPDFSRSQALAAQSSGGSSSITLDAAPDWLVAGSYALLCGGGNHELIQIASIASEIFTLESALASTWPIGTRIRRAFIGLLDGRIRASRLRPGAQEIDVRLSVYPGAMQQEPEGVAADILDGFEIFAADLDWSASPSMEYLFPVEQIDFGIGRTAQFRPIEFAQNLIEQEFAGLSNASSQEIERAFLRSKGARAALWLPTGEKDIILASEPSGSSIIAVGGFLADNFGSVDYAEEYLGIQICLLDGSKIYRRVANISANGGNSQISLSASVGFTQAQVARISWMPLARFASDDLSLLWKGPNAGSISARFQTVRQ